MFLDELVKIKLLVVKGKSLPSLRSLIVLKECTITLELKTV